MGESVTLLWTNEDLQPMFVPGNLSSTTHVGRFRPATDAEVLAHPAVAEVAREKDAWTEMAAFRARNEDYYRGLLDACAPHLGPGIYTQDAGGAVTEPLRAKVPELVAALAAERDRLRDVLAAERGERGPKGWESDLRGGATSWHKGGLEVVPWRERGRRVYRIVRPDTVSGDPPVFRNYALEAMEAADGGRAEDPSGDCASRGVVRVPLCNARILLDIVQRGRCAGTHDDLAVDALRRSVRDAELARDGREEGT